MGSMRDHLKEYIENSKTPSVRGLRILLEYFYATEIFEPIHKRKIKVISVFGSARSKEGTADYRLAHELGGLLYQHGYAVVTGASRGVMQAANHGVADAIATELVKKKRATSVEEARQLKTYQENLQNYSIGLKISLPFEAENNPFLGSYSVFHYFMVRKFFFATLSSGFIACEGGWGTRDELFEMLTLVQTGKSPLMPIIYISSHPSHFRRDLEYTVKKHYIDPQDLRLIHIVSNAAGAVEVIRRFYRAVDRIEEPGGGKVIIYLRKEISSTIKKKVAGLVHRSGAFQQVHFESKKIVMQGFNYSSYGHVADVVFLLSRSV